MVNGSILIDNNGLNLSLVANENRNIAIKDFCDMRDIAIDENDSIYYIDSDAWAELFAQIWDQSSVFWSGVNGIMITLLQMQLSNPLIPLDNQTQFDDKVEPRAHGGLAYANHPTDEYLFNKVSIDKWHSRWYRQHPEIIDWTQSHSDVFPRYDLIITIMREELEKHFSSFDPKSNHGRYSQLELKHIQEIKNNTVLDCEVSNYFYELIMSHKNQGQELIAYAVSIGSEICKLNYYNRETELEELERQHGNKHAERVFSIVKDNRYYFLSIDKRHGMFELCNFAGDHIKEIRFNGCTNAPNAEPDHSLHCVDEWKRKYHKQY